VLFSEHEASTQVPVSEQREERQVQRLGLDRDFDIGIFGEAELEECLDCSHLYNCHLSRIHSLTQSA
jgi:hypothetical protein